MARRRTRSWSEIIPALVILGVILVLGLFAAFRSSAREAQQREEAARQQELAAQQQEQKDREAAEYNNLMTALSAANHKCSASASKAVTLKINAEENIRGTYTKDYIPDTFIAETPDEVRYVIRCTANNIEYGEYLGGGIAYQRCYDIQILDLSTGEVIAEESFLGSNPPSSVPAGSGDHYGGFPSPKDITDWITTVLSPA